MEEKQLTSRELEEQANALLAEADFEEINLPKKAKKAAAAKKANEDTAQAEKPAEKYPPLDEKLVASLPAAALLHILADELFIIIAPHDFLYLFLGDHGLTAPPCQIVGAGQARPAVFPQCSVSQSVPGRASPAPTAQR